MFAAVFGKDMRWAGVFEIDLATGKARTVFEEASKPRMDMNSTSYNPPNVRVTSGGKELIWYSDRSGFGHLYRYDVASGRLLNSITHGDWLVRDILAVDENHRQVWFSASGREPGDPYARYLYRVNFDGTGLVLMSPEPGDHLLTSPYNDVLKIDPAAGFGPLSPSGRYVVYTSSPLQGPVVTLARSTSDPGKSAVVERADAEAVAADGYRPPELFTVKAADGVTDLWGVMLKPRDFDPAKRYPVIDAEYASPLTAAVPHNFAQPFSNTLPCTSPSAMAELGFVVVIVDGRGTAYRSKAFSQYGFGELNIIGLDDHIAAIRALAARTPGLDLDRVGVVGGSYGGWSALRAMLEFPDFYKAGVACAPIGAMHSQNLDYHWSVFQGAPVYADGSSLRTRPDEVPQNWRALDGPAEAARLKGKLMIIAGGLDENVVPGTTMQFVDALIKADKDFELIYLPNSAHQVSRIPYTTRRIWDFLVRNLMGATPPENFHLKSSG
jgi:pimeloyl-ACP methyl ester carboxylesterase